MKQIILCAGLFMIAACTSSTDQKQEATSAAATTETKKEKINYPMPSEFSDAWEIGDTKNAVAILSLYKGWVDGNFDSFKNVLADTVELHWATGDVNKGPRDSILSIMMAYRNQLGEVKNDVHAFMPVRNEDSKMDLVLVWVKEITTAKNGKKDSVELQENWLLDSTGKVNTVYQYDAAIKPIK